MSPRKPVVGSEVFPNVVTSPVPRSPPFPPAASHARARPRRGRPGLRGGRSAPAGPDAESALAPAAAVATLSFQQVSAGVDHRYGVATDNRAYCWGQNESGELGDGTTTGPETYSSFSVDFPQHQAGGGRRRELTLEAPIPILARMLQQT
jgi:Regulator of Chromosome Condensation (RCC1) repeat protein